MNQKHGTHGALTVKNDFWQEKTTRKDIDYQAHDKKSYNINDF